MDANFRVWLVSSLLSASQLLLGHSAFLLTRKNLFRTNWPAALLRFAAVAALLDAAAVAALLAGSRLFCYTRSIRLINASRQSLVIKGDKHVDHVPYLLSYPVTSTSCFSVAA